MNYQPQICQMEIITITEQHIYQMQKLSVPTVIGIDVGANSAKVCAVLRGTVDIITNQANLRQIPTIVGFGPGQRKLGQIGHLKLKTNYKNTVLSPHRYLALPPSTPSTTKQLSYSLCPSKFQSQTLTFKPSINGKQQTLTAQQVLACFITHLISIIKHNNLEDKLIVFAVPSYFTEIEKRAVLASAEIAGVKSTKIITEGVAIALEYINLKKTQIDTNKNILFIDFGYSKLTLTLIKFTQSKLDILLQRTNRTLGIRNIDQKLLNSIIQKFQKQNSISIANNKKIYLTLLDAIQKQRKIISTINQTQLHIESLVENVDLVENLSRNMMNQIAKQVFDDFRVFINKVKIQLTKLNIQYDSIELIGGGTRIPKIIELIQQIFQTIPSRTTNSNQIIARGATLFAVQQSSLFKFQPYLIKSRINHGIKMLWNQGTLNTNPKYQQIIIESHTQLPYTKSIKLPANKPINLELLTDPQQNQPSKKLALIKCTPPTPTTTKNQLTCIFKIAEDGFITVLSIKDNDSRDIKYQITYPRALTYAQLQLFKAKQKQMHIRDLQIIQSYQLKNTLQSFIYKQKQYLNQEQIRKYTPLEYIQPLEQYLNQIQNQLETHPNIDQNYYNKIADIINEQLAKLDATTKSTKSILTIYYNDLDKLKNYASQSINNLTTKIKNNKSLQPILQSLKQIYAWADEAIETSKQKPINELPLVSKQGVAQQYNKITMKMNQAMNCQRVQQQPIRNQRQYKRVQQQPIRNQRQYQRVQQQPIKNQRQLPKHQHFEQHYDPKDYMYRSQIPIRQTNSKLHPNLYQPRTHLNRQPQRFSQQHSEQPRRKSQKELEDLLKKKSQQQQRFFDKEPFLLNRSRLYRSPSGKFWDTRREFW